MPFWLSQSQRAAHLLVQLLCRPNPPRHQNRSGTLAIPGRLTPLEQPHLSKMTPAPKLAVFTVVATLAYLGLAILGWGGFAGFFSHPALIALASTLFVLTGVALFSGGNLSPGEREDRANRWVIAVFGLIGVLAASLPAYTDRKGVWLLEGGGVRWLGGRLIAAGGALRLWPVFVLGHRFSGLVAIQPGHRLVTSG